jgi:hypothetical protein
MRGPINFNLHGYRNCLLASVKGRWSAWQEGDVPPEEKEWLECPKHVTVIDDSVSLHFDSPYEDNRNQKGNECTYTFVCRRR